MEAAPIWGGEARPFGPESRPSASESRPSSLGNRPQSGGWSPGQDDAHRPGPTGPQSGGWRSASAFSATRCPNRPPIRGLEANEAAFEGCAGEPPPIWGAGAAYAAADDKPGFLAALRANIEQTSREETRLVLAKQKAFDAKTDASTVGRDLGAATRRLAALRAAHIQLSRTATQEKEMKR